MAERLAREEEREMVNSEKRAARTKTKPKQSRLPGTGDAVLATLEELATDYDEAGKRRAQLKLDILAEMKAQKKKHYKYNGLEVTVVDGTESVRVKVEREERAAADDE